MFRIVVLIAMVFAIGCGGDGRSVKTVGVGGIVLLDDQPLEGVQVFFLSDNHAGNGRTDATGKYYLVSGAEPGTNKVYFSKIDDPKLDAAAGMDQAQLEAAAFDNPKQLQSQLPQKIPPEYASAEATKLTFDVPPGGTKSADFRLQSKK